MYRRPSSKLTGSIGTSTVLHAAAVAGFFAFSHPEPPKAMPPNYRVKLVAAPPGPRAIGQVTETPAPPVEKAKPTPPTPKKPVPERVVPAKKSAKVPKVATPTPPPKEKEKVVEKEKEEEPPPKAGGGAEGGKGADVANITSPGVDFPFLAYLENVVRRIALEFKSPDPNSPLTAEVFFIIRRDGSVDSKSIRILKKSGMFEFDLEARSAIQAAAKFFGPLPDAFADDALPIVFSFDPKLIR
jgi:periplasmic protein TonB